MADLSLANAGPGWRPDSELGSVIPIGGGPIGGVKVSGYEGEWPLWSSFKPSQPQASHGDAGSSNTNATTPVPSADNNIYCASIGTCESCPTSELSKGYCSTGHRRAVSCQSTVAVSGWESCTPPDVADYFQFLICISLIALVSIGAFVHRQKVLFHRHSASAAAAAAVR